MKVTDVWEGLLFVSLAPYRRRGVYVPILSAEEFFDLRMLAPISKRVVRVIEGEPFGIEYWWDAYNSNMLRLFL